MRIMYRPTKIEPCDCNTDKVELDIDGLTKKYNCIDCGELLGELTIGAEP